MRAIVSAAAPMPIRVSLLALGCPAAGSLQERGGHFPEFISIQAGLAAGFRTAATAKQDNRSTGSNWTGSQQRQG